MGGGITEILGELVVVYGVICLQSVGLHLRAQEADVYFRADCLSSYLARWDQLFHALRLTINKSLSEFSLIHCRPYSLLAIMQSGFYCRGFYGRKIRP